jgi:serine/threonine-protein kinase
MRALRFEREDRFPTAAAFADALEAAAHEAGIAIATPRAVSALLKDLHIESSTASVRAVSGEVKTLTAPIADQPTVRERVTPLEAREQPSWRTSHTSRTSRTSRELRDDEPTRLTFAGRLRSKRRGLLVSAGLVALALTGWLLVSGLAGGAASDESPTVTMTTSTPSLDPPSVIGAPQGSPGETATRTSPAQGSGSKDVEAPKSKRGEAAGARVPPPSATAFRPREL